MNAWVLSLIICSATPSPSGDYCQATALRFGMTRERCHAEFSKWRNHPANLRLECTADHALVAFMADETDDASDEEDSGR